MGSFENNCIEPYPIVGKVMINRYLQNKNTPILGVFSYCTTPCLFFKKAKTWHYFDMVTYAFSAPVALNT